MDICLVSMPYSLIEAPSAGIGQLLGSLKDTNLSGKAVYANLQFAEKIGVENYDMVSREFVNQCGEWIFAEVAHPEFAPDHAAYFNLLRKPGISSMGFAHNFSPEQLWQLRAQAKDFITEIGEQVLAMNPKIVGCTSQFQQNNASIALFKYLKGKDPAIITMLGGCSCDGIMGRAIKDLVNEIDYTFSGEADEIFPQFCTALIEQPETVTEERFPIGINFPKPLNGAKRQAPRIAVSQNLNTLPIPDFDDYFALTRNHESFSSMEFILPLATSRGCWWAEKSGTCLFCSMPNNRMQFRTKSSDRMIAELDILAERYGVKRFMATDDILARDYFTSALPKLAELNRGYEFFFEVKSGLSEEQVKRLAEGGAIWVQPGIESFHAQGLRALLKGATVVKNAAMLKYLRENGVRPAWNLLYAYPGEQDEWNIEMSALLPLLEHLDPPDSLARVHLDRFSPLHANPEKYGLRLHPHRCFQYCFPYAEEDLMDMVPFFEDETTMQQDYEDNPGVNLLRNVIRHWKERFYSEDPALQPTLQFVMTHDQTTIYDTRSCAVEKEYVLNSVAQSIHDHCRAQLPRKDLLVRLLDQFPELTETHLQDAIEEELHRKLLLADSGWLLSLVTLPPKSLYAKYKKV